MVSQKLDGFRWPPNFQRQLVDGRLVRDVSQLRQLDYYVLDVFQMRQLVDVHLNVLEDVWNNCFRSINDFLQLALNSLPGFDVCIC
jgi:hypothetical protein